MNCYESRFKSLKSVLFFFLITVLFFYLTELLTYSGSIRRMGYIIIGYIGVAFSGFFLFYYILKCFKNGPSVSINEKGIIDHRASSTLITWAEILSLNLEDSGDEKILVLWGTYSNSNISFSGLKPGINEVWEYIQKNFPKKIKEEK